MNLIYRFALIKALKWHNFLYKLCSYLAIKVENGLHPKYRLIRYKDFFLSNISTTDAVLDIGCGKGALAYDAAGKAKSVVGIDIDAKNIAKAKAKYDRLNIKYIIGDATKDLDGEKFDVVILSNVLEHIEKRVEFLRGIKGIAPKYLIRVPMLDRDWLPLYKKELGVEWRLDLTHYLEYTKEVFEKEMKEAGYKIDFFSVQFGEIWSVVSIKS